MWNLHYWLSLEIIAMKRGEDMTLTAIRIEMEQEKIDNSKLKTKLRNAQRQFQTDNKPAYWRHWTKKAINVKEAMSYVSDLNRMLVDKERKIRDYIHRMEVEFARTENFSEASEYYDLFPLAVQLLELEKARDAEAGNQLSGGVNDDYVEMEYV